MFDSVLGRGVGAPGRPGTGAAVSVGLPALLLALALTLSPRAPTPLALPTISFPRLLPRGPAAQGTRRASASVRPRPLATVKPQSAVPEPAPRALDAVPPAIDGQSTSAGDGEAGTGTDACATPGCSPQGREGGEDTVPLLGPEMVAPRLLSGPEPRFPAEAALERVGGTVLVRCTVTDKGTVEDCLVMKSVPLLDASVLSAVVARRYAPALFAGRPLSVRMVIPVRFVPP